MKPYERLAEAAAPDGTVLTLYRHDGAYLLRIDGIELMSTRRSQSEVQLAEIVPEVIAWNRNPECALSGAAMHDPRVHIHQGDVLPLLRAHPGVFDAIMLDVDNGAESLTTKGNAKLYNDNGIQVAMAALRPGGRVLYWSADADPAFAKALRRNGLTVTTEQSHAHGKKGAAHELIVGEKRR